MISVEAWTTIRYLHTGGKGKKTIARELEISRNTVLAPESGTAMNAKTGTRSFTLLDIGEPFRRRTK